MEEQRLLSTLAHSRSAYNTAIKFIEADDFGDQGRIIFEEINKFYKNDVHASNVDLGIVSARLERAYPKHIDSFNIILESLEPVSAPNVLGEVCEVKRDAIGRQIATAALNGDDLEELTAEYAKYTEGLGKDSDKNDTRVFAKHSVEDIFEYSSGSNTFKLYPNSLNAAVGGGAGRGDYIVIFGVPESGKTMLALNLACGFARDGHKVLVCGNEDRWSRMLERVICRMTCMTREEVKRDYRAAEEKAKRKGYDNFVFAEIAPGTFADIDMLIEEHKPDVLVVDQIRKLYIPGIKGETDQITRASDYMRRTAKRREILTIGITQAGDSASGNLILGQGDIYMSNTSVSGDADLLLGWGVNEEFENTGRRMISVIKNKLNGYHGTFPVAVDPAISKVTSL